MEDMIGNVEDVLTVSSADIEMEGETDRRKSDRNAEFSFCPLLERGIFRGDCYDVQMVRMRAIKESILDFPLDRMRADEECVKCAYNQLP